MVYRSETWAMTSDQIRQFDRDRGCCNECVVCLRNKVPRVELRERTVIELVTDGVKRNWLRWLRHVLWKYDGNKVKRNMLYEMRGGGRLVWELTGQHPYKSGKQLIKQIVFVVEYIL